MIDKLSNWSRGRLRFHPGGKCLCDDDQLARSLCYKVYREALVASNNEDIIEKFNLDNVVFNPKLVKELSEYAKKKGELCDKKWRYLVDLHRLGDYLEYKPIEEFKDVIRYWVKPKKHTWLGDEEKWYQKFEKHASDILFRYGASPYKYVSQDEFIKNGDLWCTSGSGFEPDVGKLEVFDVQKQSNITVKKNKWSVRWKMSNSEAKHLLRRTRKQMCKAVQKTEPGKVRAVISSDVSLYLKMTYVSIYLDQIFRKRKDTTLYMSKQDREKLWQNMRYDGTWRMPLDQSEFDQNVTLRQVLIIVRLFKKIIRHFVGLDEVAQELGDIIDQIDYALDGGYVIIGGEKIPIENGVLSGWRWTALIDTIVNLTEVEMAKELYEEVTKEEMNILEVNGQGDDDLFKFRFYRHCVGLWLAYESFDLKVNPGKFFVSKTRDEYLRRVYDNNIVTGYPARSVTSIMFRNPISAQETVGAQRARETLTKWKLFCERLDVVFRHSWFERKWMEDSIKGTHGLTKSILEDWLKQDCVVGGLGWNGGVLSDGLIPTTAKENKDDIKVDSPGATEWLDFAEGYGVSRRNGERFIASTLEVPIRIKIPSWVKYILTDEKIEEVPSGEEKNKPGTVAVGMKYKLYAWAKGIRWFPSLSRLKHTRYYSPWELEQPKYYEFKKIARPSMKTKKLLKVKKGISGTLAGLSDRPDLVYEITYDDLLKHKPRSWQRDFYAGRLKAAVPIVPGYGPDVVGVVAQSMLNAIIIIYLNIPHPTLEAWYSLQRNVVDYTLRYVKDMSIRVVE